MQETSRDALAELSEMVSGTDRVYGMIYIAAKAICLAVEEGAEKIANANAVKEVSPRSDRA